MLLPYYYTLLHEASTNGMPIMRPVFFADPKDLSLRAEEEAFLIGDNLLIIPAYAKQPALPKGIWKELSLDKDTWRFDYSYRKDHSKYYRKFIRPAYITSLSG